MPIILWCSLQKEFKLLFCYLIVQIVKDVAYSLVLFILFSVILFFTYLYQIDV